MRLILALLAPLLLAPLAALHAADMPKAANPAARPSDNERKAFGAHTPPPQPADTGRHLVGALMAPIWGDGTRWRTIAPFPERKPLLGFYDEGAPEVVDWEVKWALEHGISFFMPCWFRAADNRGKSPVTPVFDHWLAGLAASRYGRQIKFALLWENQNAVASGVASEEDLLTNLLPFWIERYFRQPNYLLDDGKPVLAVYDTRKLVEELGGEPQTAVAVTKMRAACVRAGFKGLTILGQHCWGPPEASDHRLAALGFDYQFAYHLPTFSGRLRAGDYAEPERIMQAQEDWWRTSGAVPQIPTVSVGWDSTPWGGCYSKLRWQLTPAQFQSLCGRARTLVNERAPDSLAGRMVLLDNWNEYGEGHFIAPAQQHRFAYLDALRAVFAPEAAQHADVVPEEAGCGPYDRQWQKCMPKTSRGTTGESP